MIQNAFVRDKEVKYKNWALNIQTNWNLDIYIFFALIDKSEQRDKDDSVCLSYFFDRYQDETGDVNDN